MARVNSLSRNRKWKELSIVLVDDAEISPLNFKHLGRSGPTDVLSFCYEPFPGENSLFTGEIVVNVERAANVCIKGSRKDNWDASRELALYIAHGCNHLLDEQDYDPAGRARMRRRELRWLRNTDQDILQDLITDRSTKKKRR